MMIVENRFNIGDIVYLKTDTNQQQRIVTKISIAQSGLMYMLGLGDRDSWHYDVEISAEKDILKAIDS